MNKKFELKLFAVLLSLMAGVLGCHQPKPEPQSLLSPEGQSLCELYQSLNRIKMDAAEAKGLIEAREKVLAEQELILPAGKDLLKNAQAGQPIVIDSISYAQEQASADLARREGQCQFLRQALIGGKIYLGKLEDMIADSSEIIAKDRLKLNEAEADQAEIMAYQSAGVSAIKAKTTKGQNSKNLLISARAGFEEELKRIQKSQRLDPFPDVLEDVLEENFIPTTFWLRQVMIYQAETERQRLAAEEERRSQEEAEKKKLAAEAEKRRQDEEAKYMDKLLIKAEEEEKREKAAKEEQRRQAEVKRKQKEAEDQRRLQAEAKSVSVCVVDNWMSDVPAFLFINKKTGQRIPVSLPPVDGHKQYCVKQMPTGGYHVEIQYNGRVWSETDVEVTKELSASYDSNWYHCVVKASDGHL